MNLRGNRSITAFIRDTKVADRHHAIQALRAVEYDVEEAERSFGLSRDALVDAMDHVVHEIERNAVARRACACAVDNRTFAIAPGGVICQARPLYGWDTPHDPRCPMRLAQFFRAVLTLWLRGSLLDRLAFWNGALEQKHLFKAMADDPIIELSIDASFLSEVDSMLALLEPRWARRALLEARVSYLAAVNVTSATMADLIYENVLLKHENEALRDPDVWERELGAMSGAMGAGKARDVAELLGGCIVMIDGAVAAGLMPALIEHGLREIVRGGCKHQRFP